MSAGSIIAVNLLLFSKLHHRHNNSFYQVYQCKECDSFYIGKPSAEECNCKHCGNVLKIYTMTEGNCYDALVHNELNEIDKDTVKSIVKDNIISTISLPLGLIVCFAIIFAYISFDSAKRTIEIDSEHNTESNSVRYELVDQSILNNEENIVWLTDTLEYKNLVVGNTYGIILTYGVEGNLNKAYVSFVPEYSKGVLKVSLPIDKKTKGHITIVEDFIVT